MENEKNESSLARVELSMHPSKSSYDLKIGQLLVIKVTSGPFFGNASLFIGEIIQVGPVKLKIGDKSFEGHSPIIEHGQYAIQVLESCLIQGTLDEQNAVVQDYCRFGKTIRSGLSIFGGDLVDITRITEIL